MSRWLVTQPIRQLRILSRDEYKHAVFLREFSDERVRCLIGDVRDRDRLELAFEGVDIVIHAAALKRIEMGERDPLEFVRTNVRGAENVIHAARAARVPRVLALSSDKACQPTTLYGASKMVAERLFVAANVYTPGRTRFSCVRYGNVAGSRGSLIPLLLEQRATGRVTLTDPRMTRFHMYMSEAVELVRMAIEQMEGEEIFVPKLPSVRVVDVLEAVAPGCAIDIIGIRGAEKLHEVLVSADETRNLEDRGDHFVIRTSTVWDEPSRIAYASDNNDRWLSVAEIAADVPRALAEAA
jgi:FlaA1/EpsC-like NDP-sugar epimerase